MYTLKGRWHTGCLKKKILLSNRRFLGILTIFELKSEARLILIKLAEMRNK
jgi:hypothetical protein